MILIRIAYSANLPTPAELLDGLKKNSNLDDCKRDFSVASVVGESNSLEKRAVDFQSFDTPEELVNYLISSKKMMLSYSVKNDISFAEFSNGKMKISISEKVNSELLLNLQNVLKEATGINWEIDILTSPLGQTIADKETEKDMRQKKDVMELPLVKLIMTEFKGAKIESFTRKFTDEEDNKEMFVDDLIYLEEEN